MSKYVKKIGTDKTYKKPKITYQDKLTADEIADKLQGYEKVDDISEVPLNTHIRYFDTLPDGTQKFRTGGFLYNKQNPEQYVLLSNGKVTWPVQVNKTIFFRKMSHKDEISSIHALYKKKLQEKDSVIEKLKKYIKAKGLNDININGTTEKNNNSVKNPSIKNQTNINSKKSSGSKTSRKK